MLERFGEVLIGFGALAAVIAWVVGAFLLGFKVADKLEGGLGFIAYMCIVMIGIMSIPAGYYVIFGG